MKKILTQTFDLYGDNKPNTLDRFKYRGKGRPRKTDYSPFHEVLTKTQREVNRQLGEYIDSKLFAKKSI